ncbi:hypothetical protein [Streptomyces sp. NPDC058964]|uniref:hypothetical protein n=1 Tax=Streptomyces sp. NPDC058964 TaxID=3346681 RepID=UPI0036B11795
MNMFKNAGTMLLPDHGLGDGGDMGCLLTAGRAVCAVIATWLVLVVLLFLPCLFPTRWMYYIYSPASVGLWMLAMAVAPVAVLIVKREWIRKGR